MSDTDLPTNYWTNPAQEAALHDFNIARAMMHMSMTFLVMEAPFNEDGSDVFEQMMDEAATNMAISIADTLYAKLAGRTVTLGYLTMLTEQTVFGQFLDRALESLLESDTAVITTAEGKPVACLCDLGALCHDHAEAATIAFAEAVSA